ncbi:YigZ family protein [Sulfurimonas sp. SWIR-19]|uniref:IMPACT family protein n=1 Tax=Sulfurimonas sp. SWIR-19 TaxID=2878390 RepID=UPI001CF21EBF|nr:YigZ family protein [Sulfurimonas sp. SWIR-19]UCM99531.1 YigZ family protein [Sulfurimonas sp. SWIR-19]
MYYIKEEYTNTLEVKQSKFIACLVPYDKYETLLHKLKEEHPKARHFVTAYRYLNEYEQIVEHSSDDGEPSGTSGKPSLMVLQGQKLINTAVIVVRYFGGTKLGTGGLVRAYSDAVNLVIEKAELYEYKKELTQKIVFDYSDVRFVEYECQVSDIVIGHKEFDTKVSYIITASEENMKNFLSKTARVVTVTAV